jgi:hypothetical protein
MGVGKNLTGKVGGSSSKDQLVIKERIYPGIISYRLTGAEQKPPYNPFEPSNKLRIYLKKPNRT